MICHFATAPKSVKRIREELEKKAKERKILAEGSDQNYLNHLVQFDLLQEVDYMQNVVYEALRFSAPVP